MSNNQQQYPFSTQQIQLQQIAQALQSLGYLHTDRVFQLRAGGRVTLPALDKPPKNRSASVYLFPDGQGAHLHDWTNDFSQTIWPGAKPQITKAEAVRLYKEAEHRRHKVQADMLTRQSNRARYAQSLWRNANTSGTHGYIKRKGLSGLHNARIESNTGAMLIPIWVSGDGLVNLQRIYPDGIKRFLSGARTKGAYSVIGNLNNAERVLVSEGWSTGATLFERTGLPVVVAFNAGNLMAACQVLRSRFLDIAVVVAGDDDRQNVINTGRQKAIEAAEAIGAELLFPELCKCCKCSDHNDVMVCRRRCDHG